MLASFRLVTIVEMIFGPFPRYHKDPNRLLNVNVNVDLSITSIDNHCKELGSIETNLRSS